MSNEIPQSPRQRLAEKKSIDARGFPAVIGQATSPYIGKKFNDVFIVKRHGDGVGAARTIHSFPIDNTEAKNSVWLDESYPTSTGLAEIFAALRYKDPPTDLVKAIRGNDSRSPTDPSNGGSAPRAKGFGAL